MTNSILFKDLTDAPYLPPMLTNLAERKMEEAEKANENPTLIAEGQLFPLNRTTEYEEVEVLLLQAYEMTKILGGDYDVSVAQGLFNLGIVGIWLNKYETKREESKQLIYQIIEKNRPALSVTQAVTLHACAQFLMRFGTKYTEVQSLLNESLSSLRKLLGVYNSHIATCLTDLGTNYMVTGDYSLAESLFSEALEITQAICGSLHPSIAHNQCKLASVYKEQGKLTEAKLLYQKTLDSFRKRLGDDHPVIAHALANL
jgi:tetratricopeptide (TPR) repeat protein